MHYLVCQINVIFSRHGQKSFAARKAAHAEGEFPLPVAGLHGHIVMDEPLVGVQLLAADIAGELHLILPASHASFLRSAFE